MVRFRLYVRQADFAIPLHHIMKWMEQEQDFHLLIIMRMRCLLSFVYAKKTYFNDRRAWNEMVLRAMKQDFSWDASAREYEKLYDGLIEEEARRKEAIRLQQAREAAEAALKRS